MKALSSAGSGESSWFTDGRQKNQSARERMEDWLLLVSEMVKKIGKLEKIKI